MVMITIILITMLLTIIAFRALAPDDSLPIEAPIATVVAHNNSSAFLGRVVSWANDHC